MSEKLHLHHVIEVHLPEVESSTAVRFCPQCGQQIPNHRRICEECEKKSRRKPAPHGFSFSRHIPIGKLPQREFLIAGLVLGGFLLIALLIIWLNPSLPPQPTPMPVHTPMGTIVPVILLQP